MTATDQDAAGPIETREQGRFLAVLERLGCSLAISTRPNRLLLLGAQDGRAVLSQCLFYRFFRPMGLAAGSDRLAIATLNELFIFANVPEIARELPDRPDFHDAVFVPRLMHFTGTCDLHDMVFLGDTVLAVNTRYSCLSLFDGRFNFTPVWRPPFITELAPQDRCHLNGMAVRDGQARYVTLLGASNEPEGWRDQTADGGLLMEVPSGRVVASGLSMPHSPRLVGDRLIFLEGGRGRVLEADPASGETRELARAQGFTHGLSAYGGVLFVGLSKLRNSRGTDRLPINAEGRPLIAGIAAIDAATGETLGSIEFLDTVEEVYDVQMLPGVRRPAVCDPITWFNTMSVVTPEGGMWIRTLAKEAGAAPS